MTSRALPAESSTELRTWALLDSRCSGAERKVKAKEAFGSVEAAVTRRAGGCPTCQPMSRDNSPEQWPGCARCLKGWWDREAPVGTDRKNVPMVSY